MAANKGGAPTGNQNARKAKVWTQAIDRALKKRSLAAQRDALDDLAEELLKKCDEGDLPALKELGDRLEGKPAQSVTVGGEEDAPLRMVTRVTIEPLSSDD